jgi:orotate phosphoribosyltransferase
MIVSAPDESISMRITPSRQIAKSLLKIGAVKFNVEHPFKWTSGIDSPIYCDNRVINSRVEVRDAVIEEFMKIISDNFAGKFDTIAGVATGGMPYGVLIADRLKLPFIYVRSERKEYGMKKVVEGDFKVGERVILIEDHISTGKSSLKAAQFLKEENVVVICLLSIMTYGFKEAEEKFKQDNVPFGSICNLDIVLDVAKQENILSTSQVDTILQFRESPKTWNQ